MHSKKFVSHEQYCKENKTPDEIKCPVPNGGCRYAYWNNEAKWCQLIGDTCDWQNKEDYRIVFDLKPGTVFLVQLIILKHKYSTPDPC